MEVTEDQLSEELKSKRICRFCLTQQEPLSDIFSCNPMVSEGDSSCKSKTTPLTLQIMACVSIEVYKDDGMPSTICNNCRQWMDHSYRFKQICKKADTLLKTYPLTGVWPEKLDVPVNPFNSAPLLPAIGRPPAVPYRLTKIPPADVGAGIRHVPVTINPIEEVKQIKKVPILQESSVKALKPTIEPQVNREEEEEHQPEHEIDIKPKIVKLSIEDLRNIKQGRPINSTQLIKKSPTTSETSAEPRVYPTRLVSAKTSPVKIINGTLNSNNKKPVLLNSFKPAKITEEHFVHTPEGTLEIISMEASETDLIKNAPPVETHVFPCNECERSFPLRQLLEIHMQNHNRERNHPCGMCDKRFFSKYDLAKHNLTHTGERPFVCVICKSAFSRSTLLTRHQRVHRDQPKYLCMYCNRTFFSDKELQKHSENHQKKRPFQCGKCPKRFAYKQGLERHEVTHETNLPFPCEHCDLTFASAGKLARHLTAHAGSRPYPCRLCSRSFMLSHHLTRHVRSHRGGQGAYKCNDCSNVFNSQDDLIYHSAIHATTSLTCPLCRDHFETVELVTEHIKHHSEGTQFACDYCDLLFTSEQRLDTHCQEEHLSVLAMDRTEESSQSFEQVIIENIVIGKDGSKTITTIVDGERKEERNEPQNMAIKSEIFLENVELEGQEDEFLDENIDEQIVEQDYYYEEEEETVEQPQQQSEQTSGKSSVKIENKASPISAQRQPSPSKTANSKSVAASSSHKTTQQKLDSFLKKVQKDSKPSVTKTVGEVLKSLPKGVVIKRPATSTVTVPVDKKVEPVPVVTAKTTSPKKASAPIANQKKLPVVTSPDKGQHKSPTKQIKTYSDKQQPKKSIPSTGTKRPLEEDSKSAPAAKRQAVESKKQSPSTLSNSNPKVLAKPVSKPSEVETGATKKNKTFEMKIGNKMVKVQKVVMTKAEVAAMARDGKIEMQGDTMILKQPRAKK
ncbi:transcriptional repressor CTCF isoform X2 [Topomyia yanbarensis]|uniref:transcriptional repressor CTCF isoform X2 n=1 Tax=Topomyia yanbarensis TaxID=2498891 RepID=UPI00273AA44F|nr:transcriptional repressor CTCF isoform X2 [Topomyia yanbarensis]